MRYSTNIMRTLILLIASVVAITLSAQSVTDNAIRHTFMGQPCEAVYNFWDESLVRNADGSTDHRVSFSLTLFTHTAMNSTYGQTFVCYNPNYQSLRIDTAYTVRRDGTLIPMPENALVEVLPSWAARASDFNHLKEAVIVHTGLDLGSTIHLTYTLHSAAGFNKNLDFIGEFCQSSPIIKRTLTIRVPKTEKIRFALYSPEGEIVPNIDDFIGENRVTKYIVENVPASSREAWQRRSIQSQWRWYTTLSDTKTEWSALVQSGAAPEIAAWGKRIVDNEPDISKREKAVFDIAKNAHSIVKIPYNLAGGIRSYEQQKNCGYQTPWERTLTIAQMLSACNIQASPAMVFPASMPKAFRLPANATAFAILERKDSQPRLLRAEDLTPLRNRGIAVEAEDTSFIVPVNPITTHTINEISARSADAAHGCLTLSLPANLDGAQGWDYGPWPTLRETDIEIPAILEEADTFLIHVDKGLSCASRIDTLITSASGARLQQSLAHLNDSTIQVVRALMLPKKIYNPLEYADLRRILNLWISPNQSRLLFIRKPNSSH